MTLVVAAVVVVVVVLLSGNISITYLWGKKGVRLQYHYPPNRAKTGIEIIQHWNFHEPTASHHIFWGCPMLMLRGLVAVPNPTIKFQEIKLLILWKVAKSCTTKRMKPYKYWDTPSTGAEFRNHPQYVRFPLWIYGQKLHSSLRIPRKWPAMARSTAP